MKNVMVTGATGFVGKRLVDQLECPTCVVRSGEKHLFPKHFTVGTINGSTDWSGAFDHINVVVHLAGIAHISNDIGKVAYEEVNTEGTLLLAKQASLNGVQRFVFISSIGVNGSTTKDIAFSAKDTPKPHDEYTLSKYKAELGLKQISDETGMEVVIVRPTLVYGPQAPGNFGALTKLISKLPILPFGLAKNRRSFIAVQNLVDLLKTCAVHPNAVGRTFLASDLETVSIKQFSNAIAYGLGKNVVQLPVPVSLMRLAGKIIGKSEMIEQLYGNLEVDYSDLEQILEWKPPFTMKQAMMFLRNDGVT